MRKSEGVRLILEQARLKLSEKLCGNIWIGENNAYNSTPPMQALQTSLDNRYILSGLQSGRKKKAPGS
jgi:hypothetical protein